jgi:hypothetical protein
LGQFPDGCVSPVVVSLTGEGVLPQRHRDHRAQFNRGCPASVASVASVALWQMIPELYHHRFAALIDAFSPQR